MIIATVESIQKSLGGLVTKQAIEAANTGDAAIGVDVMLNYYDKAYAHYTERQEVSSVDRVKVKGKEHLFLVASEDWFILILNLKNSITLQNCSLTALRIQKSLYSVENV